MHIFTVMNGAPCSKRSTLQAKISGCRNADRFFSLQAERQNNLRISTTQKSIENDTATRKNRAIDNPGWPMVHLGTIINEGETMSGYLNMFEEAGSERMRSRVHTAGQV
jgi:hypothetical protein